MMPLAITENLIRQQQKWGGMGVLWLHKNATELQRWETRNWNKPMEGFVTHYWFFFLPVKQWYLTFIYITALHKFFWKYDIKNIVTIKSQAILTQRLLPQSTKEERGSAIPAISAAFQSTSIMWQFINGKTRLFWSCDSNNNKKGVKISDMSLLLAAVMHYVRHKYSVWGAFVSEWLKHRAANRLRE